MRKFSTAEVVDLTGATLRQVDYWCHMGVLGSSHEEPPGSGTPRRFDEEDLQVFYNCHRLADAFNKKQPSANGRDGNGRRRSDERARVSDRLPVRVSTDWLKLVAEAVRFDMSEANIEHDDGIWTIVEIKKLEI